MKKTPKINSELGQKYVQLLGINILGTSEDRLIAGIREKITHNAKFSILTPNSELVLASLTNPELRSALNSATFAPADSVGLNFASKFLYGRNLNVIPGRKLFERLIQLVNKNSWTVFFLGGRPPARRAYGPEGGEAQKAADNLKRNYQNVQILTLPGPSLTKDGEPKGDLDKRRNKDAIDAINKANPKLLFVAFGNPKQEIWITKNLKYLNVGGAMAVGGTFRYLARFAKLPPQWMEKAGLEWLWRLITEPRRVGRIFNASIIFPLRIFWFKLTGR